MDAACVLLLGALGGRGDVVCGMEDTREDVAPRCPPGLCSPGHLSAGSGGTCPTDATLTLTRWPRSGERLSSSKVSAHMVSACVALR